MALKDYFDAELRVAMLNAAAGSAVGYASFLLSKPLLALAMAVASMGVLMFILQRAWKMQQGLKWWFSNAFLVFLFSWFIIWTVFYDAQLFGTLP